MIHYHGTPITGAGALAQLAGRCFCASFATHERGGRGMMDELHRIGQSVMLDNGAFSAWRSGYAPDWDAYMGWCEPWLDFQTTWAVVPDVIGGSEEDNDLLLARWFKRRLPRGAPVWHMHESLDRLRRLCAGYPRVCLGSSAQYAVVGDAAWHRRMEAAMNAVCGSGPPPTWLHMLRGMALSGSGYPFALVDSTDVAQNHNRPQNTPAGMAARWDAMQCPARWTYREQLELAS